jgi:signal transduction histidine kinase
VKTHAMAVTGPLTARRGSASAMRPSEEQQLLLSILPASPVQRRLALCVALFLLAALAATAPLTTVPIGYIREFIPAYATAMFVIGLITSALLFVQFSIVHSRALLAISSGYLFTALITIPWALTFPDLLGQTGQRSVAWALLSMLWHAGFPVFVISYVLLKDDGAPRTRQRSLPFAIATSVAAVTVLAGVLALLANNADRLLPSVFPTTIDFENHEGIRTFLTALMLFFTFLALVLLWSRWRSLLDMWLMVVMCAWLIEVSLIFVVGRRYVVGWYAARVYGLVAATFVLAILLSETTWLYAQLARSMLAEGREREARLMTMDVLSTSIAHEMNQPLASVVTNADAAVRWLSHATPDLEEVKTALEQIRNSAHRASELIGSIRAMVKKDRRSRSPLDLNTLVSEVLALVDDELQRQRIAVEVQLDDRLPSIEGDRVQLQQVLINLVTNAMEAMAENRGPRILRFRTAAQEPSGVLVAVEDTGTGIDPKNLDRIFNPLFSTKSNGMGMGLSICRSIVEGHHGRLWASAGGNGGTVFQLVLPTR